MLAKMLPNHPQCLLSSIPESRSLKGDHRVMFQGVFASIYPGLKPASGCAGPRQAPSVMPTCPIRAWFVYPSKTNSEKGCFCCLEIYPREEE